MLSLDHRALREDYCMTDRIFQLTDIAGPIVIHEPLHGRGGKQLDLLSLLEAVLLEEMLAEHGNVFFAISEGRHVYGNDVQPVVEVVPESTGFNFPVKVPVGRRQPPKLAPRLPVQNNGPAEIGVAVPEWLGRCLQFHPEIMCHPWPFRCDLFSS